MSSKSLGKHTRICSNQVSNVRNEHATKELHMRMIESGFKTARGENQESKRDLMLKTKRF